MIFIFLRKKSEFSAVFSSFHGQRSVTAAWATRSPWSIITIVRSFFSLRLLLLTHFGESPSVWSRPLGPPAVPGVFSIVLSKLLG